MRKVDGLLTTLKQPCCRRPGQPPQGYRFISHEEMQKAMRVAALQLGYQVRFNQTFILIYDRECGRERATHYKPLHLY